MKVILPMAGRGSRFEGSGFTMPKPLIPVLDKPMFLWALESLQNTSYSELIIIALKEHEEQYHLSKIIFNYLGEAATLLLLDNVTEGQLCTVLAAKKYINSEEDILIISSDTIVKSDLNSTIKNKSNSCKGIISVANMPGDRWSFASVDAQGRVDKVAEKTRISNHASTGLYYFTNGDTFIKIAEEMIANKEKTKGEYYIIPVYQKYIDNGWEVTISEASAMWDLGTPDALQEFLRSQ
jgi:UDP-N-acetylglucosamine diphosphorylase / glucose-1-phosphate thymidylyltransferase / UDP-N-acetylgalactosamine diphosphorylase / glucosamine-1-phosphate N-acetyltransferase / galactosamine-1-phosphate N-acetyltransferase